MWIESHQSLRDHPKKDRLAELLFNGSVPIDVADHAAVGLLHELWWWALDYAPDGDLSRFTDRQIAKGCRWYGDAAHLVKALTEAGFIDAGGETRCIHDWRQYAGKLLAKRDADRERMAQKRSSSRTVARRSRDGRATVAGRSRDGRANVAGTNQPTYLYKDKVQRKAVDKSVDNCPVCSEKGFDIALAPAEDMSPRCPVCGYVRAAGEAKTRKGG